MLEDDGASGAAEIGANLGTDLTPEEKGAIFRDWFYKICTVEDEIAALNEKKKKLKRLAKNDGFASDDITWALKARNAEDTETVLDALKRRFQIAGWLNFMPPGYQPDLFKDDRDEIQRAYGKGMVASSFNRTPDPAKDGYDPPSPEGQSWLRGFNDESADSKANLASARDKLLALKAEEEGQSDDPTAAALPKTEAGAKKKPGTTKLKAVK